MSERRPSRHIEIVIYDDGGPDAAIVTDANGQLLAAFVLPRATTEAITDTIRQTYVIENA